MPVKDICDEGALLAIWVPSSLLQEGLDVLKDWGFNHKQTYIWVKNKKLPYDNFKKFITKSFVKNLPNLYNKQTYKSLISSIQNSLQDLNMNDCLSFGMGRLFRQSHEICLIGTNHNKIYKSLSNKSQRSVSFAENLKHSTKPEHLQNSLDIMFPGDINRLELFARRQRKNWFCLGNESIMTKGEDIFSSLHKLVIASDLQFQDVKNIVDTYETSKNQQLFDAWSKIV